MDKGKRIPYLAHNKEDVPLVHAARNVIDMLAEVSLYTKLGDEDLSPWSFTLLVEFNKFQDVILSDEK